MIFEAILSVIKYITLLIIGWMPQFPDTSSWVNTSIKPLMDVILSANYFVDVRLCFGCFVAVIVFSNIEFIWAGIMWVVRKIPGVN